MDDEISEGLRAYRDCETAHEQNISNSIADLEFSRLGEQWPETVRRDRKREGRPTLTVNLLPSFIRQVVNDARQNRPQISIMPNEDGDSETAEILAGLIRNIEVTSRSDIAYDTAVDSAVSCGVGYFRINIDYAADDTFAKDIVIRPIANALSVMGDPWSESEDGSDWNVAFVTNEMAVKKFRAMYPGAEEVDWASDSMSDARSMRMLTDDRPIRVAEWWTRETATRNLFLSELLGRGVFEDQIDELAAIYGDLGITGQPRKVPSYKVRQRIMTSAEVLESIDWPGRYIPIVPVYGELVNIQGQRHWRSLIRDAKDSQQMFNYWRSTSTELVALAPRAPFIGPAGAFQTSEWKWATANTQSHAFIEYDGPVRPERQPFSGVPAGVIQEAINSNDDIKAILGLYNASLGAASNETSGRAILARQREGDTSTFHFIDNLSRAIRHAGSIIVDLLPHVIDSERIMRVLGPDLKATDEPVRLSMNEHNPAEGIYNIGLGKYDVVVRAGPSYTTQREQSVAMLTELVRSNPQAAAVLGDVIVDNMDIPGGDRVVKRLRRLLPDEIRTEEDGDEAVPQESPEIGQLRQVAAAAAKRVEQIEQDRSLEERKLGIEAFRAETERMAKMQHGDGMSVERIVEIATATVLDILLREGHSVANATPPGARTDRGDATAAVGIVPPVIMENGYGGQDGDG